MAEIADRRPPVGAATRTTTQWNLSNRRADAPTTRTIAALEVARRLADLPRRAEALHRGLDNDEDDPALLFTGLPYPQVMAAAAQDPYIAVALELFGGPRRWVR